MDLQTKAVHAPLPAPEPHMLLVVQAVQQSCRNGPWASAGVADLQSGVRALAAQKLPDLQPLLSSFPEASKLLEEAGEPWLAI